MALQMAWQPNLLHHKRKTGPPLGLKNLGNTCYLNSVLQCLTYTPPLANYCLKNQHSSSCDSASGSEKKRDCPFCILERRITRSLSVDLTLDAPSKLNSCLRSFAEHFRLGQQEDAHEFLRYVIDACHNSCLRIKKLQQQRRKAVSDEDVGASTVFKGIFGGALRSQVKCLSCGSESNKVDEIMDISLDVLHSSSVKESLQKFFQAEVLEGNNKYNCENCKKLVAARKQMKLLQAPNVLVIQLKRFEGILGGKIDRTIAFEEILGLSSYMSNASQDPSYPEYKLFATVVHSGFSPDSGHYYAYVKDPMGRWYCCNDSYVTVSTLPEVLSEKVYMLFFTRTKQNPVTNGDALCSNGTKHQLFKGSETSKAQDVSFNKIVPKKQSVVSHFSENDSPNISMPNKQENDNSRNNFVKIKSNGKVAFQIHKAHSNGTNGTVAKISQEKVAKIAPLQNGNGVKKCKFVDENAPTLLFPNGNSQPSAPSSNSSTKEPQKLDGYKNNKEPEADVPVGHGFQNGVRSPLAMSGSKRKTQDSNSHVLFAKDAQSQTELDALKESLVRDASGALQFCGWTNEVYSFMRSRKKLCLEERGADVPQKNELKTILIQEGKRKFISQIPESLKENLIQRLIKSFSRRND